MESSLSKHITELNKLSYKNQRAYIAKKLISTKPNDITHLTFLTKLQINFTDFIKDSNIGDEKGCRYCFNSNLFDEYIFHRIEVHITIYCKKISHDEYLVTIPIKSNLEEILTNISIK